MSAWIQHIKKIQAERGISYKDAMKEAKHSYHKGSPSMTRPHHEDFMAHKGSRSKTRPHHEDFMAHKGSRSKTKPHHIDYEGEGLASAVGHTAMYLGKKLGIKRKHLANLAGFTRGGAVGDIEIVPSDVPTFGNTNLGVMRVPQAHSRFKVVNATGEVRRPLMRGGAIIQQESNQTYLGEAYDGRNLGANGVVRL